MASIVVRVVETSTHEIRISLNPGDSLAVLDQRAQHDILTLRAMGLDEPLLMGKTWEFEVLDNTKIGE